MINILHIVNGEQYSGLERVIDHLADKAPEYGYRFHVVCIKPGEMIRRINTREAYIHRVLMRSRVDLKIAREIQRIALETDSRLIHSHTVRGALIARLLKKKLPLPWVHHVHSPARYESEHKLLNYINYLVEKYSLVKADSLVPVSEALSDYVQLKYRIPASKITTVHNGVPIVSEVAKGALSRGGPPIIGVMGLFRPRKGIETLLLACQRLLHNGFTFTLQLIGEFVSDAYMRYIKGLVAQLGLSAHVEYTGFRRDVNESLGKISLFILPSLYGEGLPMALLEAMAMRRVIVASSVDGVTDTLRGGQCGYLVPPGDSDALARVIEKAVTNCDYSATLAAAAQERQRSNYSIDAMAHRVFEVYKCYLELK